MLFELVEFRQDRIGVERRRLAVLGIIEFRVQPVALRPPIGQQRTGRGNVGRGEQQHVLGSLRDLLIELRQLDQQRLASLGPRSQRLVGERRQCLAERSLAFIRSPDRAEAGDHFRFDDIDAHGVVLAGSRVASPPALVVGVSPIELRAAGASGAADEEASAMPAPQDARQHVLAVRAARTIERSFNFACTASNVALSISGSWLSRTMIGAYSAQPSFAPRAGINSPSGPTWWYRPTPRRPYVSQPM